MQRNYKAKSTLNIVSALIFSLTSNVQKYTSFLAQLEVHAQFTTIILYRTYRILNSLHKDPTFSMHSLANTENSCYLVALQHELAREAREARERSAFIISCLRPQHVQHLVYYCGAPLIFAYGVGLPKVI